VEQADDRAGAALGGGLEEVVGGRRTAQDVEVGDRGRVAERGSEGQPRRVVQPSPASVSQCGQQGTVMFAAYSWQLVQVLGQRFPNR